MQLKYLFFLYILKNILSSSPCAGNRLSQITVPQGYDPDVMPDYYTDEGTKVPVNISVAMAIEDVVIHYLDQDVVITIILRVNLSWYDKRLKYESIIDSDYIFLLDEEKIWIPPVVFLLDTPDLSSTEYVFYRIYPNSSVHSTTVNTVISKKLNTGAPLGFSIRLVCLKYTVDNLTLEWDEVNPLEINADPYRFHPLDASMESDNFEFRTCNMNIDPIPSAIMGVHSCLELFVNGDKIMHKRSTLLTVYVPGSIIVILSWTGFWIDIRTVLCHTVILLACLIHLFVQKVTVVKKLLVLENREVLNIWFDVCLGFVFAALFEKVIVTFLYKSSNKHRITRSSDERLSAATTVQEEEEECIVEGSDGETNTLCNHFHFPRIWLNGFPSTADAINAICRVLFPLCFVIFLCVFFTAVN